MSKDYLGQNSTSDFTPLDMDVELIGKEGKMRIAKVYANFDTAVYNSFTFVRYNTETGETLKTSSNTLVDGNNVFALYKENSTDLFSYSY